MIIVIMIRFLIQIINETKFNITLNNIIPKKMFYVSLVIRGLIQINKYVVRKQKRMNAKAILFCEVEILFRFFFVFKGFYVNLF